MATTNFQSRLSDLRPKLMSFAYSLTKDKAQAQQLLDDTTVKVLASEATLTADTNFNGWVLTQMRSIFRNRTAAMAPAVAVYEEAADCYQLNVEVSMEKPQGTFAAADMAAAIGELSDAYSRPFDMYAAGYSYKEIAGELHLPVSIVKSRILHAQAHLQSTLG